MMYRSCKHVLGLAWLLSLLSSTAASGADDGAPITYFNPPLIRLDDGISMHKDIYLAPLSWSREYHGREMEVNFQISAKVQLFNSNLYFAFTQKSFWQAYNGTQSSPFRETNYNPEIFYRIAPRGPWLHNWGMDIGVEHESNGQALPGSRSWNRVYVTPYFPRRHDLLHVKFWYRIPEPRRHHPLDAEGDDNPDIEHYLGYAELRYLKRFQDGDLMALMLRGNAERGRGAFQLNYDVPGRSKDMYYRFSLWHGYGETLIDYDRSLTRLSIGVSFFR
ncbi:MAG: phospholipase A [Pseudomonadota bacterium]